jgi:hypothetical protein
MKICQLVAAMDIKKNDVLFLQLFVHKRTSVEFSYLRQIACTFWQNIPTKFYVYVSIIV